MLQKSPVILSFPTPWRMAQYSNNKDGDITVAAKQGFSCPRRQKRIVYSLNIFTYYSLNYRLPSQLLQNKG
jgi:hypothetical protein